MRPGLGPPGGGPDRPRPERRSEKLAGVARHCWGRLLGRPRRVGRGRLLGRPRRVGRGRLLGRPRRVGRGRLLGRPRRVGRPTRRYDEGPAGGCRSFVRLEGRGGVSPRATRSVWSENGYRRKRHSSHRPSSLQMEPIAGVRAADWVPAWLTPTDHRGAGGIAGGIAAGTGDRPTPLPGAGPATRSGAGSGAGPPDSGQLPPWCRPPSRWAYCPPPPVPPASPGDRSRRPRC